MLEIPEALVIARQTSQILAGCTIVQVIVGQTPHKFAFYAGDPAAYPALLVGKKISHAKARGGMVSIAAGDSTLVFSDGAALRHWPAASKRPDKHQLLLEMDDGSAFTASIQMYGGVWCFKGDDFDNPYYQVAGVKPSPLSEQFDRSYFDSILSAPGCEKLSAKMVKRGGRDTEKDLFGQPGGYQTQLSKLTVGQSCRNVVRRSLKKPIWAVVSMSAQGVNGCQNSIIILASH